MKGIVRTERIEMVEQDLGIEIADHFNDNLEVARKNLGKKDGTEAMFILHPSAALCLT